MWHEARKQERLIRGLIRIDYRKRAERRQDFYAKIQADPTQFIQVHGRRCKIHLDPAVAAAGDGAAIIVPWQGQQDNLIDRFDVRAHLDYIPPVVKPSANDGTDADADITQEERQLNYERYRILAQNDFLNVNEDKFLHQLYLEEQFGANAQLEAERNQGRKKQKTGGATIGYSYEDAGESSSAIGPQPFGHLMNVASQPPSTASSGVAVKTEKEGSDESDDSDIDMDVSIDIAKLETAQAHELNACGRNYGMKGNDFFSHLTRDADEIESLRIAREEEQEKMLLSGRKSRRERRAQKERRIANRPFSPPSYAAKEEKGKHDKDEESDSRSPSPADGGGEKITYITSFGGEDEMQPHSKITINIAKPGQTLGESCISASSGAAASGHVTYAQKVKDNLDKLKIMNETAKRTGRRRSQSRSRSRSRKRSRRRSYHRSRSHSRRRRRYRYSRSRSSSRNRYASRSPSYKRSRKRYTSSSRSSSTSSYEMSHRRRTRTSTISRSPSPARRDRPLAKKRSPPTVTKTFCMSTTTTTTTITAPAHVPTKLMPQQKPVISQAVAPTPPMISYPLPTRTMTLSTAISAAAPIPAAALQQVVEPPPPPLKRYYGRKRDDTSSSSTESSGASDAETDPTKLQRNRAERDDSEEPDVDTASECSHPLQPSMSSSTSTGNQTGKYSSATETKVSKQSQVSYCLTKPEYNTKFHVSTSKIHINEKHTIIRSSLLRHERLTKPIRLWTRIECDRRRWTSQSARAA
ncbi:CLK4-associating serine/arginine rich protein isoform X2 [Scaptodrosophila lebanonensis]|uniref:CLK4-associating serine/arginine rich protein isoform X2 n=1 Tax=Drosophila lebanonensis TaxID=7225 RepID=A0A6J2TIH0_DROLE|nr:CLK4-associating serine/arginine rich protein isoform X2 [Scaptodrosophila lebanonensis]